MSGSEANLPVNRIINGDCVEVMKTFPSESVDLVVTSPPYALNLEYEKGLGLADLERLMINVLTELHRVVKSDGRVILVYGDRIIGDPHIVPYTSMQPYYKKWLDATNFIVECGRIWVKPFGRLSFNHQFYKHGLPLPEWETVWTVNKGNPREVVNKRLAIRGCIYSVGGAGLGVGKDIHPAGFPEVLVEEILKIYSVDDDIVLDPFLGSGTTAVVCERYNRKWIGIELNKDYCDVARRRIESWFNQTRIDDVLNV